jgi:hypothetical protein
MLRKRFRQKNCACNIANFAVFGVGGQKFTDSFFENFLMLRFCGEIIKLHGVGWAKKAFLY